MFPSSSQTSVPQGGKHLSLGPPELRLLESNWAFEHETKESRPTPDEPGVRAAKPPLVREWQAGWAKGTLAILSDDNRFRVGDCRTNGG